MDSRAITKLIRARIWPELRERGFSSFTTRSAWRYWDEGIDVVNFQALGAYDAAVIGCTPFSFVLNLGIRLEYVPYDGSEIKTRDGRPAPEEWQCDLRAHPGPSIPQRRYEVGGENVWYVDRSGRNAEQNVDDARRVLVRKGLRWFDRYRDPTHVLTDLESGKLEAGSNPSPIRHYLCAYAAIRAGDVGRARHHLEALLATGIRVGPRGEVETTLARLERG